MKRVVSAIAILLALVGIGGTARADDVRRMSGQTVAVVTGAFTSTTQPSVNTTQTVRATGFAVTSGTTAGQCAWYDVSSVSDAATKIVNGNIKFELGAAASTTAYVDFRVDPIDFDNGVSVWCDANASGSILYTPK